MCIYVYVCVCLNLDGKDGTVLVSWLSLDLNVTFGIAVAGVLQETRRAV